MSAQFAIARVLRYNVLGGTSTDGPSTVDSSLLDGQLPSRWMLLTSMLYSGENAAAPAATAAEEQLVFLPHHDGNTLSLSVFENQSLEVGSFIPLVFAPTSSIPYQEARSLDYHGPEILTSGVCRTIAMPFIENIG